MNIQDINTEGMSAEEIDVLKKNIRITNITHAGIIRLFLESNPARHFVQEDIYIGMLHQKLIKDERAGKPDELDPINFIVTQKGIDLCIDFTGEKITREDEKWVRTV